MNTARKELIARGILKPTVTKCTEVRADRSAIKARQHEAVLNNATIRALAILRAAMRRG